MRPTVELNIRLVQASQPEPGRNLYDLRREVRHGDSGSFASLGQKISRFAKSYAGELIFTRLRRHTIEALVRSSRAW